MQWHQDLTHYQPLLETNLVITNQIRTVVAD
jgi:hypothetical protein